MNEFKITVEIPGLAEAISNLAAALSAGQVHTVCNQHGTNNHHIENVGTINMDALVVKENPTTAPAPAQTAPTTGTAAPTPAPDPAPATAATTAPAADEAAPSAGVSVEDIRSKFIALSAAGLKKPAREIVSKYADKLSNIPADKYAEVLTALKKLEGKKAE